MKRLSVNNAHTHTHTVITGNSWHKRSQRKSTEQKTLTTVSYVAQIEKERD